MKKIIFILLLASLTATGAAAQTSGGQDVFYEHWKQLDHGFREVMMKGKRMMEYSSVLHSDEPEKVKLKVRKVWIEDQHEEVEWAVAEVKPNRYSNYSFCLLQQRAIPQGKYRFRFSDIGVPVLENYNGHKYAVKCSNVGDYFYHIAVTCYKDEQLVEAVECLEKAAMHNHAKAQYNLAVCYELGDGVEQNYALAVKWYQVVADQGDAASKEALKKLKDLAVEKRIAGENDARKNDYVNAVKNYRTAAELGDADAQNDLGACYAEGEGVAENLVEAAQWYLKSAMQGNKYARSNLGACYYYGKGVTKSYEKAAEWWIKAAEQGMKYAQNNLGMCYYNGEGVTKSYENAAKWWLKSAEQGVESAKNNLKILAKAWLINKNYEQAMEYYQKAYDLKNLSPDEGFEYWANDAGDAFARAKQYGNAITCYKKAYELKELSPYSVNYWNSIGDRFQNIDVPTAISCYQTGYKASDTPAEQQFSDWQERGKQYLNQDSYKIAGMYFAEAEKINGSDDLLNQYLLTVKNYELLAEQRRLEEQAESRRRREAEERQIAEAQAERERQQAAYEQQQNDLFDAFVSTMETLTAIQNSRNAANGYSQGSSSYSGGSSSYSGGNSGTSSSSGGNNAIQKNQNCSSLQRVYNGHADNIRNIKSNVRGVDGDDRRKVRSIQDKMRTLRKEAANKGCTISVSSMENESI
jgi:TPR repeat protein